MFSLSLLLFINKAKISGNLSFSFGLSDLAFTQEIIRSYDCSNSIIAAYISVRNLSNKDSKAATATYKYSNLKLFNKASKIYFLIK